ncbi:phosphoenolpyruvate synthase [Flavobacterium sp. NRK F10]|uniref:Phosphoenolpyruvate synthase n=1 Tax=Flavobacterium sediminis TaxID=2201181 RepID=A0A2U8QY59_9FLAO|nr:MULTISPECIES: phosphoenolpyruvate synthase [Flavobacterium]AWM15160.1 phosphoenolpyruvate synthase [Flavobacterium sediminis]MCO6176448.1 phosphoenolpyruvate synthase [Flavobacterium sp. NRK F10]
MNKEFTIPFTQVNLKDVIIVGGKNASLGEMIQNLSTKGIQVPDGFATTALAYWTFLEANSIRKELTEILATLDLQNFSNLKEVSTRSKELILEGKIPFDIEKDIRNSYQELCEKTVPNVACAVRSSATAEDLPGASFAGQQETYLNIVGIDEILSAFKKCLASLFTERAIKYRIDNGFDHMKVALSVGIQQMIRSDLSSSGVAFTLDPDTGFRDVILISGIWGLGENIVQGAVDPDEFIIFKPALKNHKKSIISKRLGKKQQTMVYAPENENTSKTLSTTINRDTPPEKQKQLVLNDYEIIKLAHWLNTIEEHYKRPMDVEWAKDGLTNELYIVQARPETVYADQKMNLIYNYTLKEKGEVLTKGIALGNKITSGKARILQSPDEADKLKEGEVLITNLTDPDWDPIMKKAAAIITNKGGRTSHAAIVAREMGAVAIVGTGNATTVIKDGDEITVSCAEGKVGIVYKDKLNWSKDIIDTEKIKIPETAPMLIMADPDKAFKNSFLPNKGVGLMRMEFVINNSIKIHPMALIKFEDIKNPDVKNQIESLTHGYDNKNNYFIDKLSQAIAMVAAAFYPKDVILRMSDFKSNEYANLIGGQQFEPKEENPMLGFRGASRYYSPLYKEGFKLECEAVKVVRNEMGFTNVKLMIPFCRTVEEGKKVLNLMTEYGLKQGQNDLEIYTMIEIPSNVILAEQFAEIFDGFSIGSNDLTQLTLGIDRDSELVSDLFNEQNEAVKTLISTVIQVAKKMNTKVGLCGQAPSDFPEFAQFLVEQRIDSISFNSDALIRGIENILIAEKQ